MIRIILGGLVFGSILFIFSYVASKKSGKYYLAPMITFFSAVAITAYGFFEIGGFEGMGFGFLGAGFLIVSIVGTLFLPILSRREGSKQFSKGDKITLVLLPVIFFTIIGLTIYLEDGYWIIDQGSYTYSENGNRAGLGTYYEVSTILEGRKQVVMRFGEDFLGKEIEVEKVSKFGPTEITLKVMDGGAADEVPFLTIGVDELQEPLTVKTSDGYVLESISEQLAK